MMKEKMWAYLIHLSTNMWGDPDSYVKYAPYYDYMATDEAVWKEVIDFLPSQGINTVVIDVGDAMEYESHPEISVPGAWSKDKLKKELNRIRSLGMTPIPKLNLSTTHDAWLGIYSRMVSTPEYYKVVHDVLTEVHEVFDSPEYFHIGMDEEGQFSQRKYQYCVIRQHDLWWHDLYDFLNVCEKLGTRPWVWADKCTGNPTEYIQKMPKSVLQSNWCYKPVKKNLDGTYTDPNYDTYLTLAKAGFDQVPTCSAFCVWYNALETMELCKAEISDEKLLGVMTAPWYLTTEEDKYSLLNDAYRFGEAKKKVYL